ncbi:hypothetical protein DMNBHIDG_02418 [Candidatus Methanoperedenaceae archaeon GB37]|nr:hypothetical protein DMNBHIDG_02418 [Candidatus Methanoperedenaceae archaeon GB37]
MTLQFALCNFRFAIAVRLSCPSGNRLRRLREYKMMDIRKIPNLKMTKLKPACACPHADRCQIKPFGIWILKFGFFRSYLNVCSFC